MQKRTRALVMIVVTQVVPPIMLQAILRAQERVYFEPSLLLARSLWRESDISSFCFYVSSDSTDQGPISHHRSASLPVQRFQALSTINQTLLRKKVPSTAIMHPRNLSLDIANVTNNYPRTSDANYATSQTSSFTSSTVDDLPWHRASISNIPTDNEVSFSLQLIQR